ncbi:serine/threonine-protein kinase TBK1-like [Babylonia areolata]|uniref:serine/threonine-protein kinase TBK1-like n=1 Tax=Babylonia areolata TaxID=304850 RepID=UPI003FD1E95B
MANVRGTARHTYSVDDRLGQGATGNVFKGLSKEGEFHALKIFEPFVTKEIEREVAALKELKHENIIRFIGVEDEMMSRQLVVVMEYCEGGSLSSYLQEPDNWFGLPEAEFLLLLKHLVSGMEHLRSHGFVHRDIKPGNILRAITQDGTSVFKLSDFGTARPLEDDEYFHSLVGTEEYLHPDLFKVAIMNEGESLRFPHSVDLWSVGATIYNAATGSVPFCPYNGRRDPDTMYAMITKKPAGVIGARQESARGAIQWLYELPDTTQLPGGLQKMVVSMLVSLLERDPCRVWSFERFFEETQSILACEAVAVLALFPHHSPFDAVYLPPLHSVQQLKEELGKQWSETNRELHDTLYGESRLRDWLDDSDQLFDMPPTDHTSPIIALPAKLTASIGSAAPEPSMAKIVSEVLTFSGVSVGELVRTGREMSAIVSLIDRRTATLALFQQHLLKLRHRLRFQLRHKMQEEEKVFHNMTELFDVIQGTASMANWSQQEKHNFEQVKQKMSVIDERLQTAASTVKLPFEDNQWNFDGKKSQQQTRRAREEILSCLTHIQQMKTSRYMSQYAQRCLLAHRNQMELAYKRAVRLWSEQCFQKVSFLRGSFMEWYSLYLESSEGIEACEEDLSTVVSLIAQLFKSCVNRSQGYAETQKVHKSLLISKPQGDTTQLVKLKKQLLDLTNSLEEPEVFGVPPP